MFLQIHGKGEKYRKEKIKIQFPHSIYRAGVWKHVNLGFICFTFLIIFYFNNSIDNIHVRSLKTKDF